MGWAIAARALMLAVHLVHSVKRRSAPSVHELRHLVLDILNHFAH